MAKYGSKAQMEKEGPVYKPLKAGSYTCKLTEIKVVNKPNYDRHMVDMIALRFAPYEANAKKTTMFDHEGGTIKPLERTLFMDIEKVTMGFRDNYTAPSKFRSLIAALQKLNPMEEIDGPDELTPESGAEYLKKFLGEYVTVNISCYEKNGKWKNKIIDFMEVEDEFEPDQLIEKAAEQKTKERAAKKGGNTPVEDDADEEEIEEIDEEEAPKKKTNTRKPLF